MTPRPPFVIPWTTAPGGDLFQHIHTTLRTERRVLPEEAAGYERGLIKVATRTSGRRMAGMPQAEGCLEAIRVLRAEAAEGNPETLSAVYVGRAEPTGENWAGFVHALDDVEANVHRWALPSLVSEVAPRRARPGPG